MRPQSSDVPFLVLELAKPSRGVNDLFLRAFRSQPPDFPRHFVAIFHGDTDGLVAGYTHYTAFEQGVFLCGGLCVDARVYRRMSKEQREATARQGSLSRWLSVRSIAGLGPKRAVFAFTGDARSRRDAAALEFVPAEGKYLFVQWHDEPADSRSALVSRVASLGPF